VFVVVVTLLLLTLLRVRRRRLDHLCASRSSASDYSNFRFPVIPRGPVTQYPLTTTANTTTTTTTATLATKSRDLDSIAASYESVVDDKSNGKSTGTSSGKTGTGNGKTADVSCDWIVSPGWKLRRRVTDDSGTNQHSVADRKSVNGDDKASSGGQSEYIDIRIQSAQGKNVFIVKADRSGTALL